MDTQIQQQLAALNGEISAIGGEHRIAYRVFVLRCWAEPLPDTEGISGVLWARRYSVEDVDTHTRYGFASLVELLAFLARASDGSRAMKA